MARDYAQFPTAMWRKLDRNDWIRLTGSAQWTYMMLSSQGNISLAGHLPYTPNRWSGLCSNAQPDSFHGNLCELAAGGFVCFDQMADEVLLLPYMNDQGYLGNLKMMQGVMRDIESIYSDHLRAIALSIIEPHLPEAPRDRQVKPALPTRPRLSPELRLAVFVRDGWRCQYCGLQFEPRNEAERQGIRAPISGWDLLEVDHVFPHSLGGELSLENSKAACSTCNRSKGNKVLEGID